MGLSQCEAAGPERRPVTRVQRALWARQGWRRGSAALGPAPGSLRGEVSFLEVGVDLSGQPHLWPSLLGGYLLECESLTGSDPGINIRVWERGSPCQVGGIPG